MKRLARRRFVHGAAALALTSPAALALQGCRRAPTREEVLRSLVERIMVPQHERLSHVSRALASAAARLAEGPLGELEPVCAAFRESLLEWMRAYSFREGPIVSSHALMRALYWPTRPAALQALLDGAVPPDAAAVERIGVDRRGMFALERLLFEPELRARLTRTDATGARARALLAALAANAAGYAERAARELGQGEVTATRYAQAGQESLTKLVNQMIGSTEALVMERFTPVAQMAELGRMRIAEIRGGPSGLSTRIAAAELGVVAKLYEGEQGLGLRTLVRAAAPEVEASVQRHFDEAQRALSALRQPLELAVTRDGASFVRGLRAVRTLEVALKTELAGALGVTLMFVAGDGD